MGAAGALGLLGGHRAARAVGAQRPNIVVVVSDQQHYRAAGFVDPFFDTPTLNALAKEATVFTSAFCTTPMCSPSRASLYTGLYPHKTGVVSNLDLPGLDGTPVMALKRGVATVLDRLPALGYQVGYFGKWHLGGWAELGSSIGAAPNRLEADHGTKDPQTTEEAVRYLAARAGADRPFAMFVNYVNPHDVYDFGDGEGWSAGVSVPLPRSFFTDDLHGKPKLQRTYSSHLPPITQLDKWRAFRQLYRDKVSLYDRELGRLLGELRRLGLYDSTALVVTSDHGEMDTQHRLLFKGPFMYENVVRVPLLVRLPSPFGGTAPPRIDADAVNIDLAPTLLELAGAAPDPTLDGLSWCSSLRGGPLFSRPFVIGQFHAKLNWVVPIRMIRTPSWKYNLYRNGDEELYDLTADADECVNLAHAPQDRAVRQALRAKLERWIADEQDPFFSLPAGEQHASHRQDAPGHP